MISYRCVVTVVAALGVCWYQPVAQAANIWLSLNLTYNVPGDVSSGGSWKVVGKADERGIAAVVLQLRNVNFDLSSGFLAPAIFYSLDDLTPNPLSLSYDAAGFNAYGAIQVGRIELVAIQGDTQFNRRLYDVGVIGGATSPGQNGTPAVAPGIASRQTPWGTYADDPRLLTLGGNPDLGSFTGGVEIAAGTFDVGDAPGWGISPLVTDGNVWSTTSSLPATDAAVFLTIRHIVPEPSALIAFAVGATGVAIAMRHRRSSL